MHLTPIDYVISVIGSRDLVAKIAGRSPLSIIRWRQPVNAKGGCGGSIPRAAQIRILKYAKKKSLPITAEDLILGRQVKKVK